MIILLIRSSIKGSKILHGFFILLQHVHNYHIFFFYQLHLNLSNFQLLELALVH